MDDDGPIPIEEIRQRAYDLWDRHHRPEGQEMRFWVLAERELRAERRTRRDGPASHSSQG
ncbi:hypothetical protein AFCDBAGC_3928 [Methylobacterium cerastii]|uniref:DUF2934 domain-containing protein n=1 Tax=Methylobacterium cerastii TaxID=932741 RepID=A0ABQ4QLC7_9HYPH|nr:MULTISPECIES: DUF2934 domain-containing protein [Methylobacterium]TXN00088.1 DUF2934 domain-containing protein [Methylobacterium sp. WL122]TXM68574.1 DUF2934 domain-containing protein [Methylobacterium sp. WL120]TXM72337.1 DUF2934 domain-containing protein [Methylobacterium sp. WL12]TXN81869.1 DUF2934 domain-containing protein [Methylobacterium sp. WL8]GJD46048.1 hypothetical protein AFCDBAGC_3928 [Methylobacterium cerastii]